jgi:HB1/ASXL restriction endonuclease-like protein with HTH domain
MNVYTQMLASLKVREAELVAELERLHALQAAVKPLAASEEPSESPIPAKIAIHQSAPHPATGSAPTIQGDLKWVSKAPTLADLAYAVLKEAGRPLPLKKILEGVQARGGGKGKSVSQLRASLVPSLRRKTTVFDGSRWGFYGLLEWRIEKAS